MADPKISALPAAATRTSITGTEVFPVVQSSITSQVTLRNALAVHHYKWWTATTGQIIADSTWTPIDWNDPQTDINGDHGGLAGATTIAAGSNGAALPQATINVASTASFASSGYINVTLADAKQRVISYTGKTGTSFTGCALGVGTLATGQTVSEANVNVAADEFETGIAEVAFAANATGGRAIRWRDTAAPWYFPGATMGPFLVPNVDAHIQCVMQPVGNVGGGGANRIEVWQSSGGALEVLKDGIQSPSLMSVHIGPNLHS